MNRHHRSNRSEDANVVTNERIANLTTRDLKALNVRDLLEQVYFGGKKGRRPLTTVSDPL